MKYIKTFESFEDWYTSGDKYNNLHNDVNNNIDIPPIENFDNHVDILDKIKLLRKDNLNIPLEEFVSHICYDNINKDSISKYRLSKELECENNIQIIYKMLLEIL